MSDSNPGLSGSRRSSSSDRATMPHCESRTAKGSLKMISAAINGEERIRMSLFQRARDIAQAKANKALDAAEKPDEMLDLSYEQMLDQITRVRQGLVSVAASRKQLELQEQQFQHSIDHLNDQAKAALGQGREDLAREALSRKAAAQAQIDAMAPQHEQLAGQEKELEQTLDALQERGR